jgi:hypothetical protein
MPLDTPSLLTRLVDASQRILTRGASVDAGFEELAALLSDGEIGDESRMLIRALRHAARERLYPVAHARPWSMIAGALTPMVQVALGKAIERRAEALRSDPAEHGYRGGRSA